MISDVQFDGQKHRFLVVHHENIPPFSAECQSGIRVLTDDSAMALWNEVFTRRRHPSTRLLARNHWSRHPSAIGPNWVLPWNNWIRGESDLIDAVQNFITTQSPWPDTMLVYFVISGHTIFSLLWKQFYVNWHYFLHTDQDVYVIAQSNPHVICFGEAGHLSVGPRPLVPIFDSLRHEKAPTE